MFLSLTLSLSGEKIIRDKSHRKKIVSRKKAKQGERIKRKQNREREQKRERERESKREREREHTLR